MKGKLFPPADKCVVCGKTIEMVGGRRIYNQGKNIRGVDLVTIHHKKSERLPLHDGSDEIFVAVWGDIFSPEILQRAKDTFFAGKRPWYCQECGQRTCRECGSPMQLPMGSDCVNDNGSTSHSPIYPCSPGCINPDCRKHHVTSKK